MGLMTAFFSKKLLDVAIFRNCNIDVHAIAAPVLFYNFSYLLMVKCYSL